MNLLAPLLLAVATLAAAGETATSAAAPVAGVASPVAAVDTPVAPLPLLWKISDADNAIYLLGSFHLLKESDYPVAADIDAALEAAASVVFEVTPEQLHDPANTQNFLDAAGYGDERTLSTVLPTDLREKLDALLVPRGSSAAQLDAYEPWFVNLSLVLGLAQSMGFSAEQGLDQYLMQRAASAGKATGGLESMELQLQALDATPMPEQLKGLADFLDRADEMPVLLRDMHEAWRSGDVEQLEALIGTEMRDNTPETYQTVIVDRNDAWNPQLRAMLDGAASTDTLVVVGALHLIGDDGLVEKLRAQGYAVERICSACAPTTATQ